MWQQQQQQMRHGNDVAAREARTDSETAADFARRVREYMAFRGISSSHGSEEIQQGPLNDSCARTFRKPRVEDGRVILDGRVQGDVARHLPEADGTRRAARARPTAR